MVKNNSRLKKIIVVVITTFCLLYAAIFVVSKIYLNPKEIKTILVTKLEAGLNRKVTLSDDLSLGVSWDLAPYIQLKNITVGNSSWGQQTNMLSIEKLNLKLKLWPLVSKKIFIDSLVLTNPNIFLETNNNRNNWDFGNNVDKKDSDGGGVSLDINHINITNGLLSYKENNRPARIIKLDSLNMDHTENKIKIKSMAMHIGGSNLSGNLTIDKDDFEIEGELESSLLNISDLFGNNTSSSGNEYTIPNDELPIKKLKDADIDCSLKIKKLVIDKIILTDLKIKAETKNKILHIDLDPAAKIFDGKLNINIAYNLKPKTPAFELQFKASAVKLENIIPVTGSTMEIKSILSGGGTNLNAIVGSLSGNILATATPGAYLNSSSGFANLFTTILSSALTFEKAKPSTSFSCAVVNFKVNNGIASTNKGIAMEASTVNVVGSGKIDLRNGRLNLAISPQNIGDSPLNMSQFSMGQLVTVGGTLSKPSVNLNPVGLIAGSALNKTVLSSLVGGIPGGLAAIAEGMVSKQTDNNKQQATDICKKALEQ